MSAPFRQTLSARGLCWAVGIPRHQKVYPADVQLIFTVAVASDRGGGTCRMPNPGPFLQKAEYRGSSPAPPQSRLAILVKRALPCHNISSVAALSAAHGHTIEALNHTTGKNIVGNRRRENLMHRLLGCGCNNSRSRCGSYIHAAERHFHRSIQYHAHFQVRAGSVKSYGQACQDWPLVLRPYRFPRDRLGTTVAGYIKMRLARLYVACATPDAHFVGSCSKR